MKSTTRDGVLRGGYAAAIRVLLVVAATVSAYLLAKSLSGDNVIGCGPGSDCDVVLSSRWSKVLGLPVSLFALLVDAGLLLATFSCAAKSSPKQRRKAWELMLPGALLLLGGALWFIALQLFVLHHICKWCMAAHLAGSTAAVLLLLRLPVRETIDRREKEPALSRKSAVKLGAIALLAVALFAVAQIAVAPKSFEVKSIPAAVATAPTVAIAPTTNTPAQTNSTPIPAPTSVVLPQTNAAQATTAASTSPNWFGIFGGAIKLNMNEAPIWGSPNAPHKMVSLYDYSCHHCAEMHRHVAALAHEFAPNLAVVSLPMPLDPKCNRLIKVARAAHTNACDYARLGLAVWRAKPSAIEPYDDWFFDAFLNSRKTSFIAQPPSVQEAKQRAAQLVGDPTKLEEALRDPWIDQQLAASIAIFGMSWQQYSNGSMPQFIMGTNLISGTPAFPLFKEAVQKFVNTPK